MKRTFSILAGALLVGAVILPENATVTIFTFDPNDMLDIWSESPLPVDKPGTSHLKYQQDYPRRVHETWGGTMYNTFGTNTAHTDAESLAIYKAWRASLDTADEGIGSFNIWLRDNQNAWNWGERLVSNPDLMPTATAASGWQYEVMANPWGSGWLVQWWTDDANNRLNLVNDLDDFSFTVDVREISSPGDTFIDGVDIAAGSTWDIWFGSYMDLHNDDPAYNGWQGFEATLPIGEVPEPATLALFGFGLAGLGYMRRRRTA